MDDTVATYMGIDLDMLRRRVTNLEQQVAALTEAVKKADVLNTKTLALCNAIVEVLKNDGYVSDLEVCDG
jgi:ribosomal protein S8